jgi:hypothetical protein
MTCSNCLAQLTKPEQYLQGSFVFVLNRTFLKVLEGKVSRSYHFLGLHT